MFTPDLYPHLRPLPASRDPRHLDILHFMHQFKEGAGEQFFFISGGGESGNFKNSIFEAKTSLQKKEPDPQKDLIGNK